MKKVKRSLLITGICFFILKGSFSQDPYFSQYFMSPLTLNPALTGKNVSNWRLMMNHKTQWWGGNIMPYNTNTISIEKRLIKDSAIMDQLAIGFLAMNDASGGGLLKNNYFLFSTAYNNALDEKGHSNIGVGLSLAYANRIADPSKFLFQSQFGSLGFSRSMPVNDPIVLNPSNYFDINLGIHYSHYGKKSNHYIGAAIFHAGKVEDGISQYDEKYQIPKRFVLQFGWGVVLNPQSSLQISSFFQSQGNARVISFGGAYKVAIDKRHHIHIGLWERINDAIIPYFAFEGMTWKIGLSYDAVHPNIKSHYQSVQSMEISFGLLMNNKNEKTSISALSQLY